MSLHVKHRMVYYVHRAYLSAMRSAMKAGEMEVCQRRFKFQLVVFAHRPLCVDGEQREELRTVDLPCPVDAACQCLVPLI